MAWNDATEFVIAGTGEAYVAPVNTTLPTTAAGTLNAAFSGLGFHTEDGVSINQSPEILEIMSWQSRYPTRRERQTENFQITLALQQWNEVNLPLAFGGGSVVSDGGSGYKYQPPLPTDAVDERAFIVDVIDGSRIGRFVIPRGSATEAVESQFARSSEAVLPITFKALEPAAGQLAWFFLSNDAAAFVAGS